MEIELGIHHAPRPITFTTNESTEKISETIRKAIDQESVLELEDAKGRHIIVPSKTLGYAIIGSAVKHTVGFGAVEQ